MLGLITEALSSQLAEGSKRGKKEQKEQLNAELALRFMSYLLENERTRAALLEKPAKGSSTRLSAVIV